MNPRYELIERTIRARWFPCAALVALVCIQTALVVVLIPSELGAVPVQRPMRSTETPPVVAREGARPRVISEPRVPHAVQSPTDSARRSLSEPPPEPEPVPEPAGEPALEPSHSASADVPYTPAPTSAGALDPSAPPASSAALLAENPMPTPIPSTVDSPLPAPSPSTAPSGD